MSVTKLKLKKLEGLVGSNDADVGVVLFDKTSGLYLAGTKSYPSLETLGADIALSGLGVIILPIRDKHRVAAGRLVNLV